MNVDNDSNGDETHTYTMHNDSDSDDEGNERKKNEKDRLASCTKREIVDSVDCFSGVSNLIYYYYYAWTL